MPTAQGLLYLTKSELRIVLTLAAFPGQYIGPMAVTEVSGMPAGTVRPGLIKLVEAGWIEYNKHQRTYRGNISVVEVLAFLIERLKP